MISRTEFIEAYEKNEKDLLDKLGNLFEDTHKELLQMDGLSEKEKNKIIGRATYLLLNYKEYERDCQAPSRDQLEKMYRDAEVIVDSLQAAFECEWIDDHSLAFKTNHKYIGDMQVMLASWFGLKPTNGFAFGSSFTSHQGETKNGLPIVITTTEDSERGMIKFCFQPKVPYWAR